MVFRRCLLLPLVWSCRIVPDIKKESGRKFKADRLRQLLSGPAARKGQLNSMVNVKPSYKALSAHLAQHEWLPNDYEGAYGDAIYSCQP